MSRNATVVCKDGVIRASTIPMVGTHVAFQVDNLTVGVTLQFDGRIHKDAEWQPIATFTNDGATDQSGIQHLIGNWIDVHVRVAAGTLAPPAAAYVLPRGDE